jgi:hypothetical protein
LLGHAYALFDARAVLSDELELSDEPELSDELDVSDEPLDESADALEPAAARLAAARVSVT